MAQTGPGYHEQALAKKDSAKVIPLSKEGYLQRLLEKQDQYTSSIAKEALIEAQDKFVEGVVYHGDPIINPQVSILYLEVAHSQNIERQRQYRDREITLEGPQEGNRRSDADAHGQIRSTLKERVP